METSLRDALQAQKVSTEALGEGIADLRAQRREWVQSAPCLEPGERCDQALWHHLRHCIDSARS